MNAGYLAGGKKRNSRSEGGISAEKGGKDKRTTKKEGRGADEEKEEEGGEEGTPTSGVPSPSPSPSLSPQKHETFGGTRARGTGSQCPGPRHKVDFLPFRASPPPPLPLLVAVVPPYSLSPRLSTGPPSSTS